MTDCSTGIASLIKRVAHTFKHRLDQNPDKLPLTQAQWGTLFYIRQMESEGQVVSPSDLENGLHLSRPTVTGLIQRLEARGFVSVTADSRDKRFKRLHTTPAFEAWHHLMAQYFSAQERLLLRGFTPHEENQLRDYLNRMLHNLKEGGSSL
ncbi:MAG: MarR family transcriptional regulator [Clostridia bacterium]|nr:MarR family transcriptional regulator [Clostridia bacterium]